jgi:hypothetical protein
VVDTLAVWCYNEDNNEDKMNSTKKIKKVKKDKVERKMHTGCFLSIRKIRPLGYMVEKGYDLIFKTNLKPLYKTAFKDKSHLKSIVFNPHTLFCYKIESQLHEGINVVEYFFEVIDPIYNNITKQMYYDAVDFELD